MVRFYTAVVFILFYFSSTAQIDKNGWWQYSVGFSAANSIGRVNGEKELSPHKYSNLVVERKWTTSWPIQSDKTGLTAFENMLRIGVWSLHLETKSSNHLNFTTGFEIGGRSFDILEYPSFGNNWDDKTQLPTHSNIARRSLLVYSLPVLFKYDIQTPVPQFKLKAVGGIYGNWSTSVQQKSIFYESPGVSWFYPTLHLGFQINHWKDQGLALDVGYQKGFFRAMNDKLHVYSARLAYLDEAVILPVTFNGSHLRLGIRYNFKQQQRLLPLKLTNSLKSISESYNISNLGETFELCLFDRNADGDSINVLFNGKFVETNLRLETEPKCITFELNKSNNNIIYIYALNNGRIPPNTMTASYRDKYGKAHQLTFKANKNQSIKIILHNEK